MIYNNPVDYGIEVTLDMFEELAECKNIQAVKESTRDISNVTRMKTRFCGRFKILCGIDTLALESLLMGADCWVAGLVCAFPEETVAIYKLAKAGKTKEASAIYSWFLPLLELYIHPPSANYEIRNFKFRISSATVETAQSNFTQLPEVSRQLMVLS